MSATRDTMGISSIGIQRIMPTTGTSQRFSRHRPEDDRDGDYARSETDPASPSPHPPGTGRLIDKAI
jgi:hypothetical protein